MTHTAPELEHHCGSWIIVSRETGVAVLETFQKSVAEKINTVKYDILTTLQYLVALKGQHK